MQHLIANSGIHFLTTEVEFNPADALLLPNGRTLKYAFCDTENFLTGDRFFDILSYQSSTGLYVPVSELLEQNAYEQAPDGSEEFDASGVVKISEDASSALLTNYRDGDEELLSISSLLSFRVKDTDGRTPVPAFEKLLGKWLPMPMFECEEGRASQDGPYGWCRVRIDCLGEGTKKNTQRYRLLWAFDTQLSTDELSRMRPSMYAEFGETEKRFSLCNRVDELMGFLSTGPEFSAFSDYLYSALGLQNETSHKYIAWYIYLVGFLRLLEGAAPEVTLQAAPAEQAVPVDLVLDIGNSRTCGVLFERGDFTRAMMLELRDMSQPWRTYRKSFDMRCVFRKADFGNDIVMEEGHFFDWRSLVRIGDEARNLVYRSLEEDGMSQRTTNYSSPKRYLWDTKPFNGRWEFLTTVDDPFNVRQDGQIYIPELSDLFDNTGNYVGRDAVVDEERDGNSYSRSSLMTFVLIEILQQAMSQINSVEFRTKHGDIDCRRVLRNIILTCPTAMPQVEQVRLRRQAEDAWKALRDCFPTLGEANIIPSSDSQKPREDFDDDKPRVWSYDEATCCQLVYLYAEIAQRYSGEIHRFFDLKGHVRPEEAEDGYEGKSLTIGSIDIGAGTTDLMICSYQCHGEGQSRLSPRPLFWDSFYLAGDDILHSLVQNQVIEGPEHGIAEQGNIGGALTARLLQMTDSEMLALPCLEGNRVYQEKVRDIQSLTDKEQRDRAVKAFASNLLHDFFGHDSAMMSYKDRRCRVDFNTQISVPIAQFYLEQLRLKRPSRLYRYDEIFADNKPARYLLDYFAQHFGFRFEELAWRFDPDTVSGIVKSVMEPLMKQLSVILYAHHCDILVLAGRPSSLDAITELFIKYIPISPDRLIRLNEYRVGSWYPFADGQGYFYDQKSVVAVGGMVGFLAGSAKGNFNGLVIDFGRMAKSMKSTACYIGQYNSKRLQVLTSLLTPENGSATLDVHVFPFFLGCKQLDSPLYQARPLYALYNHSSRSPLRVTFSRNYFEDRELVTIEEATDQEGNALPPGKVELRQQSLVDDGSYWLDKGEFILSVK
ncbi:MAG: virulence factor SrfB [Alloprevotella sp.]|nr:virulence factor SrfB [Alloprevotella sp.]